MRRLILLVIVSTFTLLVIAGCGQQALTRAQLTIANQVFTVYVADSLFERQTGLGDIDQLAEDEGMVFLFPTSAQQTFWMKDVEYPIDIVWVKDHQIVGFVTAQPEAAGTPIDQYQLYRSPDRVDTVVELPAGSTTTKGLQTGDKVVWQ